MIGRTVGGFHIIRELGRGGMGIVYEAEQASPRRHVALKVLPAEFAHSPGVAARFEEEANRMALLDDPHIATVYAAGEDNGTAYFAMQLLAGGDLEQRLQSGRIDQEEAAEIAAKVADALDFAHQHGIVHRDIKPANIIFSAQGEPVVTDFGIAKAADQVRMTLTGMSVCTPEYASPEQVKGNPVDGRSDLYSLGVMLYRMVCGRPLFDCENPMTWAMKHISEQPQSPGVWCPGLHGTLQHIIMKCLAKEPSERFSTGADLARALRDIAWEVPASAPALAPAATVVLDPALPAPPPPTPRYWLYALAAVGIIGLVCGAFLAGHGGPSTVAVPKVLGVTADAAAASLTGAGLTVGLGDARSDDGYPKDSVCSQSPASGEVVRKGSTVTIVLSSGPQGRAGALTAGRAIDAAYGTLGQITEAHRQANVPWNDYKALHGKSSSSWHGYLMANAAGLISNDRELGTRYVALAETLRQITVPTETPRSFQQMKTLMLKGIEAGSERMQCSAQLMQEEVQGSNPSWSSSTPYGQARSRMIGYIGDGGPVGGSAGQYYHSQFRPDLEGLR